MILRQGVNAGLHLAAGVAMGLTMVLAACTLAQLAKQGATSRMRMPGPRAPEPPRTPAPDTIAGASGDMVD
ncbi:MAG: hypothetical protein ACFBRM_07670 [Pikeienuella sp.]